jgi:hypothetical protein
MYTVNCEAGNMKIKLVVIGIAVLLIVAIVLLAAVYPDALIWNMRCVGSAFCA